MSKPWEKQAWETPGAFAAFTVYRDLNPRERSLEKASEVLKKKRFTLWGWSAKYRWVDRVSEYDAYLDGIKLKRVKSMIGDMAERHVRLSGALQGKIVERLSSIKADDLSAADVAKWLDTAVKIERLSRGETTEKVDSTVETVEPTEEQKKARAEAAKRVLDAINEKD